jgi:phosphoribosylaminoimidazolecarboxamide formyltransferase/IMP cyclohydrolase
MPARCVVTRAPTREEQDRVRALLSVADGAAVADLARELLDLGIEVTATAATRAELVAAGLAVAGITDREGESATASSGQLEILQPAVFAGILARRHVASDMAGLDEQALRAIDLVIVRLRPFRTAVAGRLLAIDEAAELIDVAGLALLAAAARNYGGVAVVCDAADQDAVLAELKDQGHVSAELRRRLAAKAFACAAAYQGEVAAYLEHIGGERFPEQVSLVLRKERELLYGENPHQAGALYRMTTQRGRSLAAAERLQGPLPTFNDLIDLDAGVRIVSDFALPTCAIVKQRNPVGLASHDDVREAYLRALSGDPVTAFGAIVAVNREVDEALARELVLNPFEAVVATGYSAGARTLLAEQPDLAVMAVSASPGDGMPEQGLAGLDFQRIEGGLLVETRDVLDIDHAQLNVVTQRRPTLEELTDLMFAWRAVRHVTSLAVVAAKGATLVGIGAGQSSRLTATEIALHRAADRAPRSVLASDAYFPFGDAIALAAERGVTAIIQPGGSIRDEMAIEVADRHHLAMVFTGRRHFRH